MTEQVAEQDSTTSGAGETSADTASTEQQQPEASTDEAALGDAGKKALDRMKADKRAAEQRAREAEQRLAALEAKEQGREAEFKAAQEAQRIKDEALAAANDRIKRAELRAAAKGKVADEALADLPLLIDLSAIDVTDDGEIDSRQMADAIADAINKRPYLAAQGSRFQGSADGGARNDASQPAQLTQADMGRMSPEQIAAAMDAGQFDRLLGRT